VSALPKSEIDLDVARIVLDTVNRKLKSMDARIDGSVTDGTLERTMDGASTLTLTVHDPKRILLRSGVFSTQVDVSLDKLFFRLVKVGKSGDDLTLTFEDREVAILRKATSPKKASRSNVTRAQFALSLIREARPLIPFKIPELGQRQAVAGVTDKRKARKALPYQFRRGGTDGAAEDSWTCLQRLAEEVQWRCFCSAGTVWFVSENWLMTQPAKFAISEDTLGVDEIDFDVDNGKARSEATVTARASRWAVPPGSVVKVSGCGPGDGVWLAETMSRGIYDAAASITLKRPTKKLAEPAPETAGLATGSGARARGTGKLATKGSTTAPAAVDAVYAAAIAMNGRRYPYVWGGGHGGAGLASGSPPGFDCSGSTVAILAAGRLGFRPGGPSATSGTIARNWGVAGEGEFITVWANDVHVFVVFHTAQGDQHFGTGRWGKAWSGAGFNPSMHPTSGFYPRHWPGT